MTDKKIIIIGAGPTGLGAAYRLQELGYQNWAIYEKNPYIGGLAASVKDKKEFIWDMGGHVIFSHYEYFDKIFEKFLTNEYLMHERKAYIWTMDRWIPYPFQNNIKHLPKEKTLECLLGLIEVQRENKNSSNFKEWILHTFGNGIAKYFMLPHNWKVWAHSLETMDKNWIAERISIVDIKRILRNIIYNKDDISWGPNNKFRFPLYGGTGGLFEKFNPFIRKHLYLNKRLEGIDNKSKRLRFDDGHEETYDILINTSPLDKFVTMFKYPEAEVLKAASCLRYNGAFIVGIGLEGKCPSSKCWMYFPEENLPFYRVTYFSNYSPNNVPKNDVHWSLLCETAYSDFKPVDRDKIIEETITGLVNCRLITERERKKIISTHLIDIDYAYPVPTLGRNEALGKIHQFLENQEVYSRGRFGGWRYEIGNMDHSIMQGVEIVDRILLKNHENIYNS